MRWSLSLCVLFAFCAPALGCGGDEVDPLDDPSTFAGMFRSQIEANCSQLAMCNDNHNMPGGPNWIGDCIQDTAKAVNNNPANQTKFAARYTRCMAQSDPCGYVACFAGPPGYGDSQIAKVMQYCMADLQCKQTQGMNVGNVQVATNVCIGFQTGLLDTYSPQDRANYEAAFPPCAAMASCDFTVCFPY